MADKNGFEEQATIVSARPCTSEARIAIVTSQLTPQRIPTYNEMAQQVGRIDVIAFQSSESNRIWSPPSGASSRLRVDVAKGIHSYVHWLDWGFHLTRGVGRMLSTITPDVIVVTGYENNGYWQAAAYARKNHIPLVIWWGSHGKSHRFSRGIVARLRRFFLRKADTYITYGTMAAAALRDMNIAAKRIAIGCNTSNIQEFLDIGKQRIPRRPGKDASPVSLLFVGQFLRRKGILELVDAAKLLKGIATLDIVGYGPLESEIQARLAAASCEHVRLLDPARTTAQLKEHYRRADVLVMPSHREVWGLVVNEALAAGLYVVAGKNAGCVPDLIDAAPIDLGVSCEVGDQEALIAALQHSIMAINTGFDGRDAALWSAAHGPQAYAQTALCAIHEALEAYR